MLVLVTSRLDDDDEEDDDDDEEDDDELSSARALNGVGILGVAVCW